MRHYAVDETTGRRFFTHSSCDSPGCDAVVKPGPDVASSGWVNCGWDRGTGTEKSTYEFCPDHAPSEAEWASHVRLRHGARLR